VTQLRKLMLEELERRNYAASPRALTSGPSTSLRVTSTVLPTNLGRITFASIRHIYSAKRSSSPIP